MKSHALLATLLTGLVGACQGDRVDCARIEGSFKVLVGARDAQQALVDRERLVRCGQPVVALCLQVLRRKDAAAAEVDEALRLLAEFQQAEHAGLVAGFLGHETPQIRGTAALALTHYPLAAWGERIEAALLAETVLENKILLVKLLIQTKDARLLRAVDRIEGTAAAQELNQITAYGSLRAACAQARLRLRKG